MGEGRQLGALNLITPQNANRPWRSPRPAPSCRSSGRWCCRPKPEDSKADDKPHGISFYEIRFKTFPPGDPRGNAGFTSDLQEFHVHGGMTHLDALCHDSDRQALQRVPAEGNRRRRSWLHQAWARRLERRHRHARHSDGHDASEKCRARQPGGRVFPEDIEAREKQTGLKVSSGDALFVFNPAAGGGAGSSSNGGFDLSVVPWLKTRGVAVTSGVGPSRRSACGPPTVLVTMGVYLLDGVGLDKLAADRRAAQALGVPAGCRRFTFQEARARRSTPWRCSEQSRAPARIGAHRLAKARNLA